MMHHDYADIRNLIPMAPLWFDEFAVPRYCEFHPGAVADIYAKEVVLAEIECQDCGQRFKVAFSRSMMDDVLHAARGGVCTSLADRVRDQSLHYGDPPNINCCPAGPTMNSDMRRVLEFWTRRHLEWERDPALEITFD